MATKPQFDPRISKLLKDNEEVVGLMEKHKDIGEKARKYADDKNLDLMIPAMDDYIQLTTKIFELSSVQFGELMELLMEAKGMK